MEEGITFHRRVSDDKLTEKLQHDYLGLYLAFHQGELKKARDLATAHPEHPVDKWRNMFAMASSPLAEIEVKAVSSPHLKLPNTYPEQLMDVAAIVNN